MSILVTNNPKIKLRRKNFIYTSMKKNKILGNKLKEKSWNLYTKNCKTLLRETENQNISLS